MKAQVFVWGVCGNIALLHLLFFCYCYGQISPHTQISYNYRAKWEKRSPSEWKKLISQLHFATHFIVGPNDAAVWLWVFRFPFSKAATATRGQQWASVGVYPEGRSSSLGQSLLAVALAASSYLVSVIWNASLTRKNCSHICCYPFVGFNFSFAGQKRR